MGPLAPSECPVSVTWTWPGLATSRLNPPSGRNGSKMRTKPPSPGRLWPERAAPAGTARGPRPHTDTIAACPVVLLEGKPRRFLGFVGVSRRLGWDWMRGQGRVLRVCHELTGDEPTRSFGCGAPGTQHTPGCPGPSMRQHPWAWVEPTGGELWSQGDTRHPLSSTDSLCDPAGLLPFSALPWGPRL